MANRYSVQQLVALVRARTDQLNSPTFDDTIELKPWVRDSANQLYEILTSRWLDYYTVARPLSLLANQESYSLPADFREMESVYLLYNNGKYREKLQMFTPEEFGRYSNENLWRRWPMLWRIMRGQLYLTPPPPQDMINALEFYYVPQYSPPLLDFTPFDQIMPNGFEEWVVLDVMQKMRFKLNMDADDLLKMKGEQQKRLVAAASVRTGEAPQMTDSYIYPRWVWLNSVPSGPLTWASP